MPATVHVIVRLMPKLKITLYSISVSRNIVEKGKTVAVAVHYHHR